MLRIGRIVIALVVGAAWMATTGGEAALADTPSNDAFAGAAAISSLPFTASEDTTQATLDATDTAAGTACSAPGGFTFSNSVWFSYTPPSTQQVRVDASGSTYGVAGAVLTGDPSSFSPVSCFLDATSFQASPGTTYYIDLLQEPAGAGGTLSLAMTELVPPNPVLTVDPTGAFDSKSGTAVMTGTESCSAGASGFLYGSLAQSVGRIATISGSGDPASPVICDGTPHPWSIVVTPQSGLFKGGPAITTVAFFACSDTCDQRQTTQTINLKH